MDTKGRRAIILIVIEVALYSALVVAYFFLVLHFLADWVTDLYERDRRLYALAALLLIVCQGLLLEAITNALLRAVRSKLE